MKFEPLPDYLIKLAVERVPAEVREVLRLHPGKLFLAGGALRALEAGEVVNDYDLFAADTATLESVVKVLKTPRTLETENAFTFKQFNPAVQLIQRRLFPSPESLLESFDFTICRAAIWSEPSFERLSGWKSLADTQFLPDVASEVLRYCSPKDADAPDSLVRAFKFANLGYSPVPSTLATLVLQTAAGKRVNHSEGALAALFSAGRKRSGSSK